MERPMFRRFNLEQRRVQRQLRIDTLYTVLHSGASPWTVRVMTNELEYMKPAHIGRIFMFIPGNPFGIHDLHVNSFWKNQSNAPDLTDPEY